MVVVKEYEQPTSAIVPKVQAVGGAGVVIGAVLTLLTLMGVTVPEGLSNQAENAWQALLVLITFVQTALMVLAGWWKKDAKPASVVREIKSVAASATEV